MLVAFAAFSEGFLLWRVLKMYVVADIGGSVCVGNGRFEKGERKGRDGIKGSSISS